MEIYQYSHLSLFIYTLFIKDSEYMPELYNQML